MIIANVGWFSGANKTQIHTKKATHNKIDKQQKTIKKTAETNDWFFVSVVIHWVKLTLSVNKPQKYNTKEWSHWLWLAKQKTPKFNLLSLKLVVALLRLRPFARGIGFTFDTLFDFWKKRKKQQRQQQQHKLFCSSAAQKSISLKTKPFFRSGM